MPAISTTARAPPGKKGGSQETLDLLKLKSVAVLGLFVLVMASASFYTNYRSAQVKAEAESGIPEPECTIYFYPDILEVGVGDTFSVTVLVDDVKNLWGYEVGLKFNRAVVEYVGAKSPSWRFVSGRIEYIFWAAGAAPQHGNVELVEFTFKAKSEGASELSFYLHNLATLKYYQAAKDLAGWPIAHSVSEGLVAVS